MKKNGGTPKQTCGMDHYLYFNVEHVRSALRRLHRQRYTAYEQNLEKSLYRPRTAGQDKNGKFR